MIKLEEYPTSNDTSALEALLESEGIRFEMRYLNTKGFDFGKALYVAESDYQRASELAVAESVEESFIVACPRCSSGRVSRIDMDDGFFDFLLFPLLYKLILMQTRGRRFRCENCKVPFRFKL